MECDTISVDSGDPHSPSMRTKSSFTGKNRENSGQWGEEKCTAEKMDRTNTEKSSDKEDMKKDNGTWSEWPDESPWAKWRTDNEWKPNTTENNSTQEDVQPDSTVRDNEFETESETEIENNPTREEEQPVRTVRVPAHQITDRKFVKVERKRRKRKDHQNDCKTS